MSEREQPKQTLDAVEHQKNLEELRRKLVESIEFIDSWQEAERKKRENISPEFQS